MKLKYPSRWIELAEEILMLVFTATVIVLVGSLIYVLWVVIEQIKG